MKNKKIIKIVLALVLVIVVAVMFLLKGKDKKDGEEKTNISYTTEKIKNELEKTQAPITVDKPTEISWEITGLDVKEKVIVEQISPPKIDEDRLKKLVKKLGLEWVSSEEAEDGLVFFSDQKGEKEMWWNVKINKLSFYKITEKSEGDEVGEEKIKNDFLELIGEVVDINKVKIEGIDYKKLVYPRWISSLKSEAEAIEIRANYYVNELRVVGFEGEPIRAIYKMDGQLVKMEIQLPFTTIGEKVELAIRNFEEVKDLPLEDFLVLSVKGGSDYELAADQSKIKKVDISGTELVYIYKNEDQVLIPYLLFIGKSRVNDEMVDVRLALMAIK